MSRVRPDSPSDFQAFLAGSPLLGEGGGGLGNHDYRIPGYAWFAQDDYRVSKTLTLNLGFRNEFLGAPYDTLCHTGNTDPDSGDHDRAALRLSQVHQQVRTLAASPER